MYKQKTTFLLVVLIVGLCVAQEDKYAHITEEERQRMDIITGCWMLATQDQAENAIMLEKILATSQGGVRHMEKIQVTMVRKCFRVIQYETALDIINSLADPKIIPPSYREIVPNHDYEEYSGKDFSLEFDNFDSFLLVLVRDLEKTMGQYFSKTTDNNNDIKIFGLNSKTLLIPFIVLIFGLGFYVLRKIQTPQQTNKRRKNKK